MTLTTEIEYTTNVDDDEAFVTRTSHYVGHSIETNKAYDLEAKTISDPKTQKATHLIFNAKPSLTAVDSFKFTDEIKQGLEKFKTDNISAKIEDMYESTIKYVSGIKGWQDLFTLVLLTFCSPLNYEFEGRMLQKGWVESLVLGDTRTGKTEMVKSVIEYFKLGEMVLGESASFAGLVGGLQQVGSRWHLTWGRIPLNNRRLVAIDEMSGLSKFEIAKLSGIRSTGIAEITKIQTDRTWAKTRLIWLSNPRGTREDANRMLSGYSQGVKAFPELIGQKEDMSRFDLVLFTGISDVDVTEINKPLKGPDTFPYTGKDFHDLVMFAWTLKPKDIQFTQQAKDYIYYATEKMADKYSQEIPLVVPNELRIKLAKLGVACACLTFNYDGKLTVDQKHIEFVYKYLNKIFDKPACGYDMYSYIEKSKNTLNNTDTLKKLILKQRSSITQLLDIDRFSQSDLQEIFDANNRQETKDLIRTLVESNALRRISNGYKKTGAFNKFLGEHKNGKLEKQIQDQDQVEIETQIDGENYVETDEEFPF